MEEKPQSGRTWAADGEDGRKGSPWWEGFGGRQGTDFMPEVRASMNRNAAVGNAAEAVLEWGLALMTGAAVFEGRRLYQDVIVGACTEQSYTALIEAFVADGGRIVMRDVSEGDAREQEVSDDVGDDAADDDDADGDDITPTSRGGVPLRGSVMHVIALVGPDAVVTAAWSAGRTSAAVRLATLDEAIFTRIASIAREHVVRVKRRPAARGARPLSLLAVGRHGLEFVDTGSIYAPLIEDNYPEDVLRDFARIGDAITTPSPRGRLAILSGPPGTGKTTLLKALVTAVPSASFVLMDPSCIGSVASPTFLPSLSQLRSQEIDRPIVFLMEDADAALAERGGDNLQHLHALLNFSNGIIGQLLNVFIVATTNANVDRGTLKIDPALLRPGRLAGLVRTTGLTTDHANRVLRRLIPNPERDFSGTNLTTLAEVYQLAADLGWRDVAPSVVLNEPT